MGRHSLDQCSGQSGLTRTNLAGQQDKPTLAIEAIFKVCYGLPVMPAGIEEIRIGRN